VPERESSGGPRRIGVDTGGTFTDLVVGGGAGARVVKLPSTPREPGDAVVGALDAVGGAGGEDHVVHGTTVALNALLTGRVARTALVTGEGFRDLIEIGRQHRPDIYALHPEKPAPLVPRRLRFEVGQRSWPDPRGGGMQEVRRPTRAELAELARRVARSGAESIAVCLLHAWADPAIEERVGRALARLGLPTTLSAAILPEHREFERFSTAVVNAALVPSMSAYLGSLAARLAGARLSILQSSGGTLPAEIAAREPVRVVLSGPAGGVVGAARAAAEAGLGAIATFDMGGTSTDVAFHVAAGAAAGAERGEDAATAAASEPTRVAGHPIATPSLDIHTIGCGGGSIAAVDAGGALHVGPRSAGAEPGPVCYGASEEPTVTDAHVLLGHVRAGSFLDGGLELDLDRVERAFEALGGELGVRPREAARAVLRSARAAMRRAIGVMTMQRGHDPRRTPLVAFGGAGGLHAAALAASLDMPGALVPRDPGALSARGMAEADALRDCARTALEPLDAWPAERRARVLAELEAHGADALVAEGHARAEVACEASLDLRYRGQSFELNLPASADPAAAFHAAHERLYGYRLERPVELVCLRVRARASHGAHRPRRPRARPLPASAVVGERRVDFATGGSTAATGATRERGPRCPVVDRRALGPGHRFEGPALVEEYSGTSLVPPGWTARVTAGGHLWLEPPAGARRAR